MILDLLNFLEKHSQTQVSFIIKDGFVFCNALIIDQGTKKHHTHNIAFKLYEANQIGNPTILSTLKDLVIQLEKKLRDSLSKH